MKFYIAAYSGSKREIKELMSRIEKMGHEITVDWTDLLGIPKPERNRNEDAVRDVAGRDINGVLAADVFVLFAEPDEGRGRYVELGAAIASNMQNGKPSVYVVGEETSQSLFYYHKSVKRLKSIEDVFEQAKC
jgi:hypothetical protein